MVLVYCREIGIMVPLMKVGLQIPFRMQGSWRHWNAGSCGRIVQGSGWQTKFEHQRFPTILPQIRPFTSITSTNHEKIVKIYRSVICKTHEMNQHYWYGGVELVQDVYLSMCVWLFDHAHLRSNAF
jgi:hypothetical protein